MRTFQRMRYCTPSSLVLRLLRIVSTSKKASSSVGLGSVCEVEFDGDDEAFVPAAVHSSQTHALAGTRSRGGLKHCM